MHRLMLFLLSLALVVSAAPQMNFCGYSDTAVISGFRADSLRITKPFVNQGNDKKMVYIIADDTSSAGHRSDSIKIMWGIQTGNPYVNLSNTYDTIWGVPIIIDTLNGLISNVAKFYNPEKVVGPTWHFIDSVGLETYQNGVRYHTGYVDTGTNANSFIQGMPLSQEEALPWAPIYRLWCKGIVTGNKKASYVNVRFMIQQQQYTGVRQY